MKEISIQNFINNLKIDIPPEKEFLKLSQISPVNPKRNENSIINFERGMLLYALITKIKPKTVLEIGAGYGNLTKKIVEMKPKKVIAIEKDKKLALFLKNSFIDFKNINIINNDIFNVIENQNLNQNTTVFGNLPYNISTQVLASLILLEKWPPWYEILILMFQKEVLVKRH